MATVTLAESAKLSQNLLVQGIIENVLTVNRFFEVFPFREIDGNALAYNRENALGDVQYLAVGGTVTAKAPATFTQITASLTKILGDAEVDYLLQATRSNINDQKAVQIASKAKSVARKYQDGLINGDGTGDSFVGLLSLCASGQKVTAGANGAALAFADLDALIDKVTDKDGQVDYIMMHRRTLRSYWALIRGLGGATLAESVNLPSGNQVPGYRGIPIFANDWVPITQTIGTSSAVCTTVFAGTFDDGSMQHGIAGITAAGDAGIRVQEIGPMESFDSDLTRIKFYTGLANFSELGLAAIVGVNN